MSDSTLLAVGLIFGLLVLARVSRKRPRFPPGPKGLPIVGNLFGIPRDHSWLTYAEWGRLYNSNIVHFEALGQHFFVLNDEKITKEIFEGRSQIYSDRHKTVMLHELTGWHRNWAFTPYGESWRQNRRLFHQFFRAQAIPDYHDHMAKGARGLVQLLLQTPENWMRHIRHASGSTVLDAVYAMDVDPNDNERLEGVERAVETLVEIAEAGGYLVDFIPALKHIPTWFPGAGFKRQAMAWKRDIDALFERPYHEVKSAMQRGKARSCVTSSLMSMFSEKLGDPDVEETIMGIAGTSYAGSDTTVFTMFAFVQAMLLYPNVQRKAQEELDRVVGRDRLPEVADRQSLPYVSAIVKEILRWNPILPAVYHKSLADDWYEGYFIPAGSIVIGNTWAVLNDAERYPDPEPFKPERFLTADGQLDSQVPDPVEVFGYGRRVCAGRHFAQTALFLYIAHVLALFTIDNPLDESGHVIKPRRDCLTRLFWVPKPFKAKFKPRFTGVEELVHMSSIPTQ